MQQKSPRLLIAGHGAPEARSAAVELAIPALLLRNPPGLWSELVHIYVPQGPTVAFSSRDLRRPGILAATDLARSAGFEPVVRSPGGQMVAYDSGAVVIDHLTWSSGLRQAGGSTFADNAGSHANVLRSLGDIDAQVGPVDGEYCPGEFSINVAGRTKVVGSAQRITGTGSLFSTVVQVAVSAEVRAVIAAVSDALGYELRTESIAGLRDYEPSLTADQVAAAFATDYRHRLGMDDGRLPGDIVERTAGVGSLPAEAGPFAVDTWARAQPLVP
ncbi:lipoyl protein ligase domain-containing protein [Aeromicrobium sp. P5_D10]